VGLPSYFTLLVLDRDSSKKAQQNAQLYRLSSEYSRAEFTDDCVSQLDLMSDLISILKAFEAEIGEAFLSLLKKSVPILIFGE